MLEVLITDALSERVRVEPLIDIREALRGSTEAAREPIGTREYVTRPIAA